MFPFLVDAVISISKRASNVLCWLVNKLLPTTNTNTACIKNIWSCTVKIQHWKQLNNNNKKSQQYSDEYFFFINLSCVYQTNGIIMIWSGLDQVWYQPRPDGLGSVKHLSGKLHHTRFETAPKLCLGQCLRSDWNDYGHPANILITQLLYHGLKCHYLWQQSWCPSPE